MVRKVISLLMSALFVTLLVSCGDYHTEVGNVDPPDKYVPTEEFKLTDGLDVREQLLAMGFSEEMLASMEADEISLERIYNQSRFNEYTDRIDRGMSIGPSGYAIAREFYGGIYFDNKGILTVTVREAAFDHHDSSFAIAEMLLLGIIVKTVEFSYSELTAAMDILNNMAEKVNKSGATSWGLDTMGNRIDVRLDPYTDEQIAIFMDLLLEASINPLIIEITQAVTQEMQDARAAAFVAAAALPGDQIVLAGDIVVSRTAVAFSLENRTELMFSYGSPWDLAHFSGGRWSPVTHLPGAGGGAWNDILYQLQSGGVKEFRYEWTWRFGELPPGRYMLIISGWLGEYNVNHEAICATVEFEITTNSPASLPHENIG